MNTIQLYVLILGFSLVTAFGPWLLMQMDPKREMVWYKIALVGFTSSIATIIIGLYLLIHWILTL